MNTKIDVFSLTQKNILLTATSLLSAAKRTRATLIGALVVAMLSFAPSGHTAVLTGDTVTIALTYGGSDFGTQSVLVGAGYDGQTGVFGDLSFDLDYGTNHDIFAATFGALDNSYLDGSSGVDMSWQLSDLDFSDGSTLIGVNVIQGFADIPTGFFFVGDNSQFTISDDALTIFFHDTATGPVGNPHLQVQFLTTSSSVPEPSSVALLLAGAGTALATWRRRKVVR